MKRIKNYLLFFLAVFLLTACAKSGEQKGQDKNQKSEIQVVTTFYVPYDLARQIGGELVDVKMLVEPGESSMEHKVSESDKKIVREADVFIYSGSIVDPWAKELAEEVGDHTRVYCMADSMTNAVNAESIPDLAGDGKADIQEIYWITPVNLMLLSSDISVVFSEISEEHAEMFDERFAEYAEDLIDIDQQFMECTGLIADRAVEYTGEGTIRSFAAEYQLHYHPEEDNTHEHEGKVELAFKTGISVSEKEFQNTFTDLLKENILIVKQAEE